MPAPLRARTLGSASAVLLALVTAAAPAAHALPPAQPDLSAWVPDSAIDQLVHVGSRTIVGGSFSFWGPYTGAAVRFSPGTGSSVRGQSVVGGGDVYAAVSDGAGGAYIGGDFHSVNGEPRLGLAHLTANGGLDPAFQPTLDVDGGHRVNALALSGGGNLYVGGSFTMLNGTSRRSLGAVSAASGALVTSWAPCTRDEHPEDGDSGSVYALALATTNVVVGGNFDELGTWSGSACVSLGASKNLGSVSASSGAHDSAWNPAPDDTVHALLSTGSTVYAGGAFEQVDATTTPVARAHAAAFPATSSTPTAWRPQPAGGSATTVRALALAPGGDVFLGGDFTSVGSVPAVRAGVARVSGTTGEPTAFDAGLSAPSGGGRTFVLGLDVSGARLLVGGVFSAGDRENLGVIDAVTGAHQPADLQPGGGVYALAPLAGGSVLAAGGFQSAQAVRRTGLAVLDERGVPTSVGLAAADEAVRHVAISPDGQTIYLDVVDAFSTHSFRSVRTDTGAPGPWAPAYPAAFGSQVSALRVSADGATVYVGGRFSAIGGAPRANLAATSAATGAVTDWRPDPDGEVYAVVDAGDRLYVGGAFGHIGTGAEAHTGLARVSAVTGAADAWAPVLDGSVHDVALSGDRSRLYATGTFTHAGSPAVARGYAAALSTTTGNPTPFDPALSLFGGRVVLGPDEADVYLSGSFLEAGGVSRPAIAAVGGATGALSAWAPLSSPFSASTPPSIAVDGDSAFVGTGYETFRSDDRRHYAQFTAAPALAAAPVIGGTAVAGGTLACTPASWRNGTSRVDVAWLRDGAQIAGATGAAYGLTAADAGHLLACRETATNNGGSTAATSAAVSVVAASVTPGGGVSGDGAGTGSGAGGGGGSETPPVRVKDTSRPAVALTQPTCGKRLSKPACRRLRGRAASWRTLRGTVSDAGGSGIARVEVAAARRSGRRVYVSDGKRFARSTTKAFQSAYRPARLTSRAWTMTLPRLARGTYLLRIRAKDRAGNTSAVLTRTLTLR